MAPEPQCKRFMGVTGTSLAGLTALLTRFTPTASNTLLREKLCSNYMSHVLLDDKDSLWWDCTSESNALLKAANAPGSWAPKSSKIASPQQCLPRNGKFTVQLSIMATNFKVLADENKGKFLNHEFELRQLVEAGEYTFADAATQKPKFSSVAVIPGHQWQIILVLFDIPAGNTL